MMELIGLMVFIFNRWMFGYVWLMVNIWLTYDIMMIDVYDEWLMVYDGYTGCL